MIKSVLIPYDKYIRLENSTRKTEEGNNKTIDQSPTNTDKMDGGIGTRKPSQTKQVDSGSNDASTFSSENKLDAPSDSDFKEGTSSKQNDDTGLSTSDDDDAIGMPSYTDNTPRFIYKRSATSYKVPGIPAKALKRPRKNKAKWLPF
ncbi:unnamed protein product [Owenia fusiformis]|uniref:Uncharacterized protein n=1 Tax=Owenia fusiformis TaxID=6347 RepID=A0A8S4NB02_OWEFU|nr:unnamed protein product [Owenia fusiformis]